MKLLTALLLALVLSSVGCANRLNTMVAPEYESTHTAVSYLGITGQGTSAATPAFIEKGYKIVEISNNNGSPFSYAKSQHIPFVATIDPVGTEGSFWDGFFDFSMHVSRTDTGAIVWSATAEYGQGGIFINQVKSTKEAMHDMVENFSKYFPPQSPK